MFVSQADITRQSKVADIKDSSSLSRGRTADTPTDVSYDRENGESVNIEYSGSDVSNMKNYDLVTLFCSTAV